MAWDWNSIRRRFNQYVNTMRINKSTEQDCRELFDIIEYLYFKNSYSCYMFVRKLNDENYPGWQGKSLLCHLKYMCNNVLELDISYSELLLAIALDQSRDEMQFNPADFAIQVKRELCDYGWSEDIFFYLCKMAIYEGKFISDDLKKIVEKLDLKNEEIKKIFSDIDISKCPTWKERVPLKPRFRGDRYSEKIVSHSYNECIAEIIQEKLSNEEQHQFVLNRYFFNKQHDSAENWELSYHLIKRLGK